MSRISKNPFKSVPSNFVPKQTTIIVLVHIPSTDGYYRQKFEILKLCLASIFAHTDSPYDLMVIDNDSMPEVIDYLNTSRQENKIQHLILSSKNIGLGAAHNMACWSALGEYVAFSNDDVYFYPKWLSQHIELFETFPKVGIVSGQLVNGDEIHSSVEKVAEEFNLKISPFDIPIEWMKKWCDGLGIDINKYLEQPSVKNCKNFVLEKDGIKAFSGGTGYTYVFKKEILKNIPLLQMSQAMGSEDYNFHRYIDNKGYMRLCTYNKLTDHIGNSLDERWLKKVKELNVKLSGSKQNLKHKRNILIDTKITQKILRYIFKRIIPYIK